MVRFTKPADHDQLRQDRMLRRPAVVSAEAGLDDLFLKLAACAQFYQDREDKGRKVAVINALGSVIEFLKGQGFPPLVLDPIDRPVKALVRLDDNAIDPLFATRLRVGAPNRAFWADYRSAILACLANLWLVAHENDGRKDSVKLREAARKMRGEWFGSVTLANLNTARQALSAAADDDRIKQLAKISHESLVRQFADFSATDAFNLAVQQQNALPRFDLVWGPILKTPPITSHSQD